MRQVAYLQEMNRDARSTEHKKGLCKFTTREMYLVFCVVCYYLVCIFVTVRVLLYYVCIAVLHTLVAGLLARSQYPERSATGHLGTGFSSFPCV